MKVTITDREVEEVKREYPYVGVYKTVTVLFTKAGTGVVLKDEDINIETRYKVGYYSCTLLENQFTPLVNKTITIEV